MVKFGNKNLALQLFNEGMLMNPEPLLQYMPTVKQYITKNFKAYVTDRETSEMFALTQLGGPNIWGYYYRSDWLKKFDMEPPTTREEIIEYAKSAFDDPDGNGIDDMVHGCGRKWLALGCLSLPFNVWTSFLQCR